MLPFRLDYAIMGWVMDMEKEFFDRKPTRLENYDYSSNGAYFITICTEGRRQILSRIVGVDVPDDPKNVELLPCGIVANKYINRLNEFYDNIVVDRYVIMPNHIHILLFVYRDGASRTSPPTARQHSVVSRFVSTFKRFCNKECSRNIWQRSFHDHIIRDRNDYMEHLRYIHENPKHWYCDELFSEE